MLPSFFRDTVKVVRPSEKEVRGASIADYENASRFEIEGCHVSFTATKIDRDGRLAIEVTATLRAPAGADIRAGDRIEYDSSEYELLGEPLPHKSPTGSVEYVEASLARWSG